MAIEQIGTYYVHSTLARAIRADERLLAALSFPQETFYVSKDTPCGQDVAEVIGAFGAIADGEGPKQIDGLMSLCHRFALDDLDGVNMDDLEATARSCVELICIYVFG